MWEIIDSKGTIHSGTQEEMELAFQVMSSQFPETLCKELGITSRQAEDAFDAYETCWNGDLKLIEVHNTYR